MDGALTINGAIRDQDQRISETVRLEQSRLRSFIRKHIPDQSDAEDILQDTFYELVEAYRLLKPIEQVGAWLFRVARNRITDFFRRKKPHSMTEPVSGAGGEMHLLEDLLPAGGETPDTAYARNALLEALDDALSELPEEQREVFTAHEMNGRTFKDISAETGIGVNTLLSRKHYAVQHLRKRLQAIYDDFIQK